MRGQKYVCKKSGAFMQIKSEFANRKTKDFSHFLTRIYSMDIRSANINLGLGSPKNISGFGKE